MTKMPKHVGAK